MVLVNLLAVLIILAIPITVVVIWIKMIRNIFRRGAKLNPAERQEMIKSAKAGVLNVFRHLFH